MAKVSAKFRYSNNHRTATSKAQRANALLSQIDKAHGGLVVPISAQKEKEEAK